MDPIMEALSQIAEQKTYQQVDLPKIDNRKIDQLQVQIEIMAIQVVEITDRMVVMSRALMKLQTQLLSDTEKS